ncbi:roadblock/LC7 domain-containing protein [Streptomyces sp. NPDC002643]
MAAEAEVLDELHRLRARIPQLTGALAASVDGLVLAHDTPGVEAEGLAALTAAALGVAVRMTDATGRGDLRELLLRGENGYVATYAAGSSAVLTLLAQDRVNVGRLHLEGRRAGTRIGALVDAAPRLAADAAATRTLTRKPARSMAQTTSPKTNASPNTDTDTDSNAHVDAQADANANDRRATNPTAAAPTAAAPTTGSQTPAKATVRSTPPRRTPRATLPRTSPRTTPNTRTTTES